ncbi:DUF3604 domain-containing protein [Hellea balneolensis]|uniref:DUF3604 domain-containing protein n=1 Tax=Hellea balneolensis TaxID=287478 RepID=UPI00042098BC|nr:DUF3604 domain-containing protein [Hellea balneolensis]
MLKKLCLGSAALSAVLLASCGDKPAPKEVKEVVAAIKIDPATIERTPTKNAYFGDLHVHTKNSFDAFITGTRTTADDAYRFAKGATIDNGAGKDITISGPPLDFYGVTDHGEYMGVVAAMRDKDNPISKSETAKSIFGIFGGGRDARMQAFMKVGTTIVTGEPLEDIYDREFIDSAWAENVAAAEKHNEPGIFTTFAAYEYTNMNIIGDIDDNFGATNLHRNVVFRDKAPTRLFTTLDSTNPENLWEWMNEQRANGIDVLAIPHNSNASNGQMFAMTTTDGSPLTKAYAENRMLNEPIVEMTQVKGTSETHPLLSPEDEFADHELYEILVGMPVPAEKVPGSFVRQALSRGIGLEGELGANPYAFGFIGSTDAHVSSSSLSEENFFGKFPHDTELSNRRSIPPKGAKTWEDAQAEEGDLDIISTAQYGASGLAGVWAKANTRDEIFDAMAAKETFATSGPRLKTRFFAGAYSDDILSSSDMLEQAYANGSPMGGNIEGGEASPDFIAWAIKDPEGYPLQRIQVVKVWSEGGKNMERIYDVACAGGAAPDPVTRRCPDNGARVDLETCKTNDETGSGELKALWSDPDYQAGQSTAYYLRVLENPKCRWSTWDAMRNGTPPNPDMHATLQDRAWSSAIWVQ